MMMTLGPDVQYIHIVYLSVVFVFFCILLRTSPALRRFWPLLRVHTLRLPYLCITTSSLWHTEKKSNKYLHGLYPLKGPWLILSFVIAQYRCRGFTVSQAEQI